LEYKTGEDIFHSGNLYGRSTLCKRKSPFIPLCKRGMKGDFDGTDLPMTLTLISLSLEGRGAG
jgi:hypothetical protein